MTQRLSPRKGEIEDPALRSYVGNLRMPGAINALAIFVVGTCTLELVNPSIGFKPWNLVMVMSAALAAAMMAITTAQDKRVVRPRLFATDAVFLGYMTLCAFSVTWSVSPVDTVVQVVFFTGAWIATLALRTLPSVQIVRTIVITGFVMAALSFFIVPLAPAQAFQPSFSVFPELRGVFQHQQRLGLFAGMVLGLLVLARLNHQSSFVLRMSAFHRRVLVFVVAACFLAAFARLNMVFTVVAIVVTVAVMRSPLGRAASIVGAVIAGVWASRDYRSLIAFLTNDEGGTLTGRLNVWERTQRVIEAGTSWGYGFASFDSSDFDAYWGDYRAPSAHNSILQATFETGTVGAILIAVLVAWQLRAAYKSGRVLRRLPYSLFMVLLCVFSSLTGVTYAGKPTILLILTLLVLSSEQQEASEAATQQRGREEDAAKSTSRREGRSASRP